MMLRAHDILHPTNVRMIDKTDNSSFTGCPDFLGVICTFSIGLASVFVGRLSWNNLDGDLCLELVAET